MMVSLPKRSFVTELVDGLTAGASDRTTGGAGSSDGEGEIPLTLPRHRLPTAVSWALTSVADGKTRNR